MVNHADRPPGSLVGNDASGRGIVDEDRKGDDANLVVTLEKVCAAFACRSQLVSSGARHSCGGDELGKLESETF